MDKGKFHDGLILCLAFVFIPIYVPHLILLLLNNGGGVKGWYLAIWIDLNITLELAEIDFYK